MIRLKINLIFRRGLCGIPHNFPPLSEKNECYPKRPSFGLFRKRSFLASLLRERRKLGQSPPVDCYRQGEIFLKLYSDIKFHLYADTYRRKERMDHVIRSLRSRSPPLIQLGGNKVPAGGQRHLGPPVRQLFPFVWGTVHDHVISVSFGQFQLAAAVKWHPHIN